jgi:transglutaminase-like putative cysteine protease
LTKQQYFVTIKLLNQNKNMTTSTIAPLGPEAFPAQPNVMQEGEAFLGHNQHEALLVSAMAQKVGNLAVNGSVELSDASVGDTAQLAQEQYDQLVGEFAENPKDSLAWARETMLGVAQDPSLSPDERSEKLDQYLDAYTALTLRLDHDAFPATRPGEVHDGTTEYVPDGFNDMGRDDTLDVNERTDREVIHVDKQALYERYKPVIKELLSRDYSNMSSKEKKGAMFQALAQKVYAQLRFDRESAEAMGGGKVSLAELSEGVCRHQALTFQVLAQALGLKSEVIKGYMQFEGKAPESHAANIIRIDGKWSILDVTNPDYVEKDGKKRWRPGVIPIDAPPAPGVKTNYEGYTRNSGEYRKYYVHNKAFWTIGEAA